MVAGGVAANSRLRALAVERAEQAGIALAIPNPALCTDNGAMVAALGALAVREAGATNAQIGTLAQAAQKIGDVVQITGNPGRESSDYRLRMQFLKRPADGFEWGRKPGETFN